MYVYIYIHIIIWYVYMYLASRALRGSPPPNQVTQLEGPGKSVTPEGRRSLQSNSILFQGELPCCTKRQGP